MSAWSSPSGYDADLFISCHHNSLGVTADSVGVSGIEVYYWNDQSQRLAELAGQSLAEDSGRGCARWNAPTTASR